MSMTPQQKRNRAKALLYKTRNYVNFYVLKAINFAMFVTRLNYANVVWGQSLNYMITKKSLKKIIK